MKKLNIEDNYFVEKIVILPNVMWNGKIKSNYSIFEFIFSEFIIDFKKKDDLNINVNIINKKNNFINEIRKNQFHKQKIEKTFFLKGNLYFYLLFNINIFYKENIKFYYTEKDIFNIKFIGFISNIVFFIWDNTLYFMQNNMFTLTVNNNNYLDIFKQLCKLNSFNFNYDEILIETVIKEFIENFKLSSITNEEKLLFEKIEKFKKEEVERIQKEEAERIANIEKEVMNKVTDDFYVYGTLKKRKISKNIKNLYIYIKNDNNIKK